MTPRYKESKTVYLKQIISNDLSFKYARDMGENKVRHYCVTVSEFLLQSAKFKATGTTKINEDEFVKALILRHLVYNEGLSNVEFLTTKNESAQLGRVFSTKNVSSEVLDNSPKLKRALTKVNSRHTIHEWHKYDSKLDMWHDRFVDYANNAILLFNRLMYKILPYRFFLKFHTSQFNYRYKHMLSPSICIHIVFEENQREQAIKAMLNDLNILLQNDLILGNLALPSTLKLGDAIGVGPELYALFCYPIVDMDKIRSMFVEQLSDQEMFSRLDLKYVCGETALKYLDEVDPRTKYEIEEVLVSEQVPEDIHKNYLESYKESRDTVNEVAKESSKRFKDFENEFEKVSKSTIGNNTVNLNVEFKKKEQ